MNHYVTGAVVKSLREKKRYTQQQLGEILGVSDKTISKWETGKGLPDVSLLEPLAAALGISVMELLSGEWAANQNRSANMSRSCWYVCPICGNVIHSMGELAVSCCGVQLPRQIAEPMDEEHDIKVEVIENEYYVTVQHPMTKEHYLSFAAYVTSGFAEVVKWYPEGNAEARFTRRGHGFLYVYCNRHGLMVKRV